MSEVVDKWVDKMKNAPQIGAMTHWERITRALDGRPTDMTAVVPEAELFAVLHSGHTFPGVFNDVDAATDAILSTWADYRWDWITHYIDMGHIVDSFVPPEDRDKFTILRGPKDYVLFKAVTTDLDEAIALFENKVWEKYGSGRAMTHFVPHTNQLFEFQRKMGNTVPVITGMATPSNLAEDIVEVQTFVKWMVTEPKAKMHRYMEAVTAERLATLEFFRQWLDEQGSPFIFLFGGARTWGPRQWDEFGKYDVLVAEKAAEYFKYPVWHMCGQNLPHGLDILASMPLRLLQYDMPMPQMKMEYPDWFEMVAKKLQGKMGAMNAPTTQLQLHGTPDEVSRMVTDFLDRTTPYTTAAVGPGCQIASNAPDENVRAMVDAARNWKKA